MADLKSAAEKSPQVRIMYFLFITLHLVAWCLIYSLLQYMFSVTLDVLDSQQSYESRYFESLGRILKSQFYRI